MALITIDETKCRRDGICAAECPLNLIKAPDKQTFPAAREGAEQSCVRCGHCVAVCPHGALSLAGMRPEDCAPAAAAMLPSPEQAEHLLRTRRSIRVYKDKPLGRETIAHLIDIARYAPSGHNNQLVEWLVVYDGNDVQRYAALVIDWARYMIREHPEAAAGYHMDVLVKAWEKGRDRICRNAPHVVVAHGPAGNPAVPTTCVIAMTYLELAAAAHRVGACWAGYFNRAAADWPPLKEALGLPAGNTAYGSMMLGYPKYPYHRIPLRKEAKVVWK
ncbi:MAG: Coenzyme F420:L-glutamate ligase [Syntrophaceae bacterium PtaU1.Bin231]|jgi:nitroreductase/NAD-dependent dihydropyrimidine dehydrogenase PreA subunit|nr:MAG: Coenzyme F420:L-glutamate ligase [Syntrophaceae bacterium PtaU1.Bin231]